MSRQWMGDQELGRALSTLEPEFGPSVDLAASVSLRISQGPHRLGARDRFALLPRGGRTITVLLAALLLGATIAAGAKLVIGAIQIQETDVPGDSVSLVPETGPNLGRPTTLDEAGARVGFDVRVPVALGEPDAVFIDEETSRVSLTWLPADDLPRIPGTPWGAILIEFRGDRIQAVKEVPIDGAERVDAGRIEGYWLSAPHVLRLEDGTAFRVDGNVLLFEREATTLRLELGLDRAAAIKLAEST